ncbi:MAG TPA: hypothetical protein PKA70_01505 [Saprospiraceae bacterium]|nr:hypothetical protein [Saprospiraceae bacterium]
MQKNAIDNILLTEQGLRLIDVVISAFNEEVNEVLFKNSWR